MGHDLGRLARQLRFAWQGLAVLPDSASRPTRRRPDPAVGTSLGAARRIRFHPRARHRGGDARGDLPPMVRRVAVFDRSGRRIAETLALLARLRPRGGRSPACTRHHRCADRLGHRGVDPARGTAIDPARVAKIPIETAATPVFRARSSPRRARRVELVDARRPEIWTSRPAHASRVPDAKSGHLDEDGKRPSRGASAMASHVASVCLGCRSSRAPDRDQRDRRAPDRIRTRWHARAVTEMVRSPSQVTSCSRSTPAVASSRNRTSTSHRHSIHRTLMTTIDKDRIVTVWSVADGAKRSRSRAYRCSSTIEW